MTKKANLHTVNEYSRKYRRQKRREECEHRQGWLARLFKKKGGDNGKRKSKNE